jgi:thiol-disulfide isomerase/thioredoxin
LPSAPADGIICPGGGLHLTQRRGYEVAALALASLLTAGCRPAAPPVAGRWDAVVTVNDVDIPFRFDVEADATRVGGSFFNGEERIQSTAGTFAGGVLTLAFDHYATRINARLIDGHLEGQYIRARGAPYPFRARTAAPPPPAAAPAPAIAGVWIIPVKSAKGEAAWRFIVHQNGPDVSAAILRVDGDTGALTGRYQDGTFVLSHFSGQRPALLEMTLEPDGSLAMLQNKRTKMTAVREEHARERHVAPPTDPSVHSFAKNPTERFRFSFADPDGRVVSSDDERFRNRVVIVSITGTWCPNCHDEAPFLAELYERYRGMGLEIVALSFEEAAQLQNPARLRAYAERYGITYPMLLAGIPDDLSAKVPQIENLNSFPTTIFLGRDGRVREVHAGFPSKASGRFYAETTAEIQRIVEELLTESQHAASPAQS